MSTQPPPLPAPALAPEVTVHQVRTLADAFARRRRWILGFMGGVGVLALLHLGTQDWLALGLDGAGLLTFLSLFRALNHLGAARQSGNVTDLNQGLASLATYVRWNAVLGGVAVLVLLGTLGVLLIKLSQAGIG